MLLVGLLLAWGVLRTSTVRQCCLSRWWHSNGCYDAMMSMHALYSQLDLCLSPISLCWKLIQLVYTYVVYVWNKKKLTVTLFFPLGCGYAHKKNKQKKKQTKKKHTKKTKQKKTRKSSPEGNCIATKDEKVDNPEVCSKCHASLGPCFFSPPQMFVVPVLIDHIHKINTINSYWYVS